MTRAHQGLRSGRVYTSGASSDLQSLTFGDGIAMGFFVPTDIGIDAHQNRSQRPRDERLGRPLIHGEGGFHGPRRVYAQLETSHGSTRGTHGRFNRLPQ